MTSYSRAPQLAQRALEPESYLQDAEGLGLELKVYSRGAGAAECGLRGGRGHCAGVVRAWDF